MAAPSSDKGCLQPTCVVKLVMKCHLCGLTGSHFILSLYLMGSTVVIIHLARGYHTLSEFTLALYGHLYELLELDCQRERKISSHSRSRCVKMCSEMIAYINSEWLGAIKLEAVAHAFENQRLFCPYLSQQPP